MELYCAIDLRGGQAVRLHQGDFDKERSFGDPLELADRFVAAGAPRLHVVDLDAARTSEPINRAVIRRVVERVPVPVQVGGGVRTDDDVAVLLGMGADRVVMGTTALREPDVAHACAARFAGRIVLALDYRHRADGEREAAVAGWSEGSGVTVSALLDAWRDDPLAAVAVTSIERDGTGAGPDLEGLGDVLDRCDHPVVASGGVGALSDLHALRALRSPVRTRTLTGVIVGMALVDGSLEVGEAVAACSRSA